MDQVKDGGPAFPRVVEQSNGYMQAVEGMTLRDYFAAKAMQGMLAAAENYQTEELTALAYDVADAMLKAREANHG